ncbi:MAG TPA: pyridoxamine 5'-phosphate oxidase family protein [Candidatus Tectomicrobia bacterium]|nr:pyridoxamine 5'-phosphate oxidase family protein [Candidatus Tectomicrobia bacterium]
MSDRRWFRDVVTSERELRDVLGQPSERARLKERAALDEHDRAFIAHAPFLLLATANAAGRCDVSPKGDPPGFVRVLDDRHLLIPDRPGNRRLDGMRNILDNPHVGVIFLVPGREETLRVNGRAWIVRDPDLLEPLAVQGKRPVFGIGVEVEEVFFHCARAFMRSELWRPERWPAPDALPTMACVLWDQLPVKPAATREDYERESRQGLRVLY